MNKIHEISKRLSDRLHPLEFQEPVTHVYNPLDYAWESHAAYLEFANHGAKVLFMGMNPGPWGMAQTGVPFGDVGFVRDFLGIEKPVSKPSLEHPKRLVEGFDCSRSEVSGSRLWGWVQERFETPENFFKEFFIWNYCPLSFMEESGRNRTPDQLPKEERETIFGPCDDALREVVEAMEIEMVVGVGTWAEKQAKRALKKSGTKFGRILHPSPASPKANQGWAPIVEDELSALGLI